MGTYVINCALFNLRKKNTFQYRINKKIFVHKQALKLINCLIYLFIYETMYENATWREQNKLLSVYKYVGTKRLRTPGWCQLFQNTPTESQKWVGILSQRKQELGLAQIKISIVCDHHYDQLRVTMSSNETKNTARKLIHSQERVAPIPDSNSLPDGKDYSD